MSDDISLLDRWQDQLREAYDSLWDSLVDPREAYQDDDGTWWSAVAARPLSPGQPPRPVFTEPQLAEIRAECRALAMCNEFAINGHENRVSFIVGVGHSYRAVPRKGKDVPPGMLDLAQRVLDNFLQRGGWHKRQQEIVRRRDRDGEAFLRFFPKTDGTTEVRFVEPDQIFTPQHLAHDTSSTFGILTSKHDVEEVQVYYVDGEPVDGAEIQHRKANVDGNVKRGLPLFFPVRKNLRRAEKLLRNMSTVAEIQSAIALIRRHHRRGSSTVRQFVKDQADHIATHPGTGRSESFRRYRPGTILDADAAVDYDFPASALDAGSYVKVLQAELRAIASRLVMPEFMLTSDASNANFASTLVAEGPAVRMFQRLQAEQIEDDREVMWRVIGNAVAAGQLPPDTRQFVEIQIVPPSLAVRDLLQEARVNEIEHQSGILSPQTWSQRRGLDYAQEQRHWAEHRRSGSKVPVSE